MKGRHSRLYKLQLGIKQQRLWINTFQRVKNSGRRKNQTRNYEDKDGKRVYITEVLVSNLEMLEYVKRHCTRTK